MITESTEFVTINNTFDKTASTIEANLQKGLTFPILNPFNNKKLEYLKQMSASGPKNLKILKPLLLSLNKRTTVKMQSQSG